jgi:hypothetical protein
MVAKSSHILVHIVLGRLGLMGKVLILWSNGKNIIYYPHMYVNLKSTPSVLIFLIRVNRLVYCKVCKNSSVRGMFIPYVVSMMYYFGW